MLKKLENSLYLSRQREQYELNSITNIKSNLSLYSLDCAEACNELAGPISASLRPGNTAPFEEMSQRWRAIGNTVSDLTGPRFEPQTSRSRDERVTARPTGRCVTNMLTKIDFDALQIFKKSRTNETE